MTHRATDELPEGVAIIGMAGRFPGARTIEEFWRNIRNGVESISFFTEDELLASGIDPALVKNPKYVRAKGVLADVELFDASFFGYTPQEARLMDPQHRIFLECGWHALEEAGYRADLYRGTIGVFAGCNFNQYLVRHVLVNRGPGPTGLFDKDFLATRLSYKLDLKGPSLTIQTACSTSLVAVAQACQGLLSYQCDMALAGGIAVHLPHKMGSLHQEGSIVSPDGHCRPFAADARGTVLGSGAGIVVLKRLSDAIEDGDRIHAVIRGFAVNNDGASKMGFMAPSIDGQAQAIAMAQGLAGIDSDSIGYVEAHGTGTELGDPIEIAALTQAFRATTARRQFCAIGSVKSNIGHLDSAAGVAGLIKTVLALEHRELPPSLHFDRPNPKIEFESSPFFVNTTLQPWPGGPTPRRAGVSSFGLGGTNAHLVLEEAPARTPSGPSRSWQLLLLSARSSDALAEATDGLGKYLASHPDANLADVAYTLQVGRKPFAFRRMLVARDTADAVRALAARERTGTADSVWEGAVRPLAYMFTGDGLVRPAEARRLYESEPAFRRAVDRCIQAFGQRSIDLRPLFAAAVTDDSPQLPDALGESVLFTIEYALAELFSSWGIRAAALVGVGVGELVAASISGVLGIEQAIDLLARRASIRAAAGAIDSSTEDERWAVALEPHELPVPGLPYVSGQIGSWITPAAIADRRYWARLLSQSADRRVDLEELAGLTDGDVLQLVPGESFGVRGGDRTSLAEPERAEGAHVVRTLGELWLRGIEPDWNAYHAGERRLRVELPVYPFQRNRYWIERPAAPGTSTAVALNPPDARGVDDWLYVPSWRSTAAADRPSPGRARFLVFVESGGVGARLARRLEALGDDVVCVRAGERWERLAENVFAIDPAARNDYDALVDALAAGNRLPDTVVHLWGADGVADALDAPLDAQLARGFYSVLSLVQALGDRTNGRSCRLRVVTARAYRVDPDEVPLPGRAAVAGLCRVIPHEYTNLSCQTIDVAPAEWTAAADDAFDRLVAELRAVEAEPVIAFRRQQRWVQSFERAAVGTAAVPRLRTDGTYLITGGLGAVGLTLASYLASSVHANLVLVGRTGLPPRESWAEYCARHSGDAVERRIRAVEALERAGANVLVAAADTADEAQMRTVIERARNRFGAIHGVIHAAGIMARAEFKTVRDLDRATCAGQFRPKVDGTVVLDRVLQGSDLDFCMLTSSLSAVLGGLGFGAYAAANAFMDAFAVERARAGWISVNWDGWLFGSGASESTPDASRTWISPADGIEAFRRLLESASGPQIVVSTGDLAARAAKWVEMRPIATATAGAPLHPRPRLRNEYVPPRTELEREIVEAWREVLGVDPIGIEDNFFELGGDSFRGLHVVASLGRRLGRTLSPVMLYEGPTVAALAGILGTVEGKAHPRIDRAPEPTIERPKAAREIVETRRTHAEVTSSVSKPDRTDADIAIVGMAGRFPGASNVERFWQNLRAGLEARTVFTDDELKAEGVHPDALTRSRFVRSGFVLEGIELFDAEFFGFNPREAELLDPQQRWFLECAWEALETAGYDPDTYSGAIGVFGGSTPSSYLARNVARNERTLKAAGGRQAALGNLGDYMVTRVAYKLNLKGPAYLVQTACSTSLVAVHLACQSLRLGESDMALAGGVSIVVPQRTGYFYEDGGMLSPDGICRAFDANARGTAFGSGAGVVLLKRLRDAVRDGDHVHAVVKGGATNNDGSLKVGFTAPSVVGQAEVVAAALENAGVSPETVSYVEAHGTGTELGDPIEVAALTRAYRARTEATRFCALGSVKPNIGHLDAAAGVSGLIKTVLALMHSELPPTINFERPNPAIDFDNSPFYVNTRLQPWPVNGTPRRAGVSSFGFGGTNAHVILEEAPVAEPSDAGRSAELLVVSARTEAALEAAAARLAEELRRRPDLSLADVAYTLQIGRRAFAHRRAVVCSTAAEAADLLEAGNARRRFAGVVTDRNRGAVFLFPGQGAQHVNMGLGLYIEEPVFRATVDECAELLQPELGLDLRDAMYPAQDDAAAADRLRQTAVAQAALFSTELALARTWMDWGIRPVACLGHSIGELVAACVAGVLNLSDAIRIVALRGRLMSEMPPGVMVAIPLPADRVSGLLGDGLWLSAVNAPSLCVVSGAVDRVDGFVTRIAEQGVQCHRLHTSHAFHSGLMDGAVERFVRGFRGVALSPPRIPFISNVTGDWITDDLATDPGYWGRHIRQPVRFSEGLRTLLAEPDRLMLEVGPGNTLGALVRQHIDHASGHVVVSSMRHPHDRSPDFVTLLDAAGRLWTNGAALEWSRLHAGARRRRVPLPTYPFERQRYWVTPDAPDSVAASRTPTPAAHEDLADWFYVPSWKRTAAREIAGPVSGGPFTPETAVLFVDDCGGARRVAERLTATGRETILVERGDGFARIGPARYAIDPRSRADYVALLRELRARESFPATVGHFWGVTNRREDADDDTFERRCQDLGFFSLLYLAQAIGEVAPNASIEITVVTDGIHEVIGDESLVPEKATVLGPCQVVPQEFTHIGCRSIDLVMRDAIPPDAAIDTIVAELLDPGRDRVLAIRGGHRWALTFERHRLERGSAAGQAALRPRGVYLITGGTGGIGLEIARHLARTVQARLILTSRRGLPPRDEWADYHSQGSGDRTARQIAIVRELEAVGADVRIVAADVADEGAMRRVVDDAIERFGRIDGVVHAAGVPGGGMIQLKDREMAAEVLRPKVTGTRVLARVLEKREPEFLILCSSLTSVIGGVGQVDYCGANAYLDAFAHRYTAKSGRCATAVNWTTWRDVGMAVDASLPDGLRAWLKEQGPSGGLSNEQGVDAFGRVLAARRARQIALSARDLSSLLEAAAARSARDAAAARSAGPDAGHNQHPRPHVQSAFVAPRTQVETRICEIWQDNLGIDRVGVDDNFFELGGHSLLAVRVMTRVNDDLGTDIPVAKLYEGLTVRFLASHVDGGECSTEAGAEAYLTERRRDVARRQKEHQQRRRTLMRRQGV